MIEVNDQPHNANGRGSDGWKISNVKALANSSGVFKSISLISNFAKLVERVIVRCVTRRCKDNSVISSHQCTSKGGTSADLSMLIDYIKQSEHASYCVFFDAQKAFDSVHIPTLLQLIDGFKFPNYLGKWLGNYLLDQSAFVGNYGNNLASAVPQELVLEPVLFQI